MSPSRHTVRSCLERVPIAELEQHWDRIGRECFTAGEREALASRRTQTRAGFLALKRALASLLSGLDEGRNYHEKQFVLTHNSRGAPELARSPGEPGRLLYLSISHTREQAYGLASLVEEEGE